MSRDWKPVVIERVGKFMSLERLAVFAWIASFFPHVQLIDPDYYWHLETGKYIVENLSLPAVDIFSYTRLNEPWVLHEWLFQAVLYLLYDAVGETGLNFLVLLALSLSLYLATISVSRRVDRPILSVAIMGIGFFVLPFFLSPRPQLVTYILFAVFISIIINWKHGNSDRLLWALPFLMVPWVNFHGAYMIGIALLVAVLGIEWLQYLGLSTPDVEHRTRLKRFALITVVTLLASSVNPYFVSQWIYPFETQLMEVTREIAEWKSPNFKSLSNFSLLILAAVFFTAQIFRNHRPSLLAVTLPLLFLAAAFISQRHIPLAVIALVPFTILAAADVSAGAVLENWKDKLRRVSSQRDSAAAEASEITKMAMHWFAFVIVVGFGYVNYTLNIEAARQIKHDFLPTDAVQFVLDHDINGRMFNTYRHGGYLINHFYPDRPVFIDGRADVYGDEFVDEYLKIHRGRSAWKDNFDMFDIDYAIVSREAAITQLLVASDEFKLVYEDKRHAVLVRDEPRYREVIRRYAK